VDRFNLLLWSSVLFDAALAAGSLFLAWGPGKGVVRRAGPLGLARLGLAGLLGGVVFAGRVPLLFLLGLNPFGLIHLAFLDLVGLLPLLGLAALGIRGQPATLPATLLAAGAVLLAPIGLYASWIEPFRLQLERTGVPLAGERAGTAPIRIGVLADVQTDRVTDYERGAFDRLMALAPDLILLPGDLFQAPPEALAAELPALRDLVGRLSAPGGVYFVLGDVDRRPAIEQILAGSRVKLLVNELARATVGDRQITIGGIELDYGSAGARRTIEQLAAAPGQDDLRLLLTHRPDPVLDLDPDTRIDLVVAGHTHGGQVKLPFVGPLMTLSGVPRQVAGGGLFDLGPRRRIYVSRGVGLERGQAPRLRFLCPPEISLLELR
jgi:uncharacterized protein